MLHQPDVLSPPRQPSQPGQRIAFIQASWHRDIVDQCRLGFVAEMEALGRAASDIDFYEIAGAFEIPLHASLLAGAGRLRCRPRLKAATTPSRRLLLPA